MNSRHLNNSYSDVHHNIQKQLYSFPYGERGYDILASQQRSSLNQKTRDVLEELPSSSVNPSDIPISMVDPVSPSPSSSSSSTAENNIQVNALAFQSLMDIITHLVSSVQKYQQEHSHEHGGHGPHHHMVSLLQQLIFQANYYILTIIKDPHYVKQKPKCNHRK
jgi:hypothetical protein